MNPEQWERISEIFPKALSLQGEERENFLNEACADEGELRKEVDSLLASHDEAGSHFLNEPDAVFEQASGRLRWPEVQAGRRIGPYLVAEPIGHGGMGEVFAATRADGQYEKKVALKLVRGGYDTSFILERFRNERQILAGLDHPNIARLLDGGTTDDGIPYLVMELVAGAPIDVYCDAHKLSITQRLVLFRQVCSAVEYAHQRLVIHRDIKPSNILVTEDGVPKLLDFGIAKILDASGSTEATMLRPMTPEYASPEQVRGEPISTSTDGYSLGVVLYQLLTGRSPYRVDTPTPERLAQVITQEEPERPSTSVLRTKTGAALGDSRENTPEAVSETREVSPLRLQKRLRGDLDFILLKALRKEPVQRYSSVEQFSEDIRRHLEGAPVAARKGTWAYKGGKFMRRHKAGVLAGALVFATLLTAIFVVLREARIAEANRRRAEARFNDVRKLADSLMFEVHDSIRQLPGATAARKLIIQRAQEYLDVLAKDSQNDPSLLRELASAYGRLASVEGDSQEANLGETSDAIGNYRKAVELLSTCLSLDPSNQATPRELSRAYQNLAVALASTGDKSGGQDVTRKAVQILEPLAASHPEDQKLQYELGAAYDQLGTMSSSAHDFGYANESFRKALAILQKVADADAQKNEFQTELSFVHKHMGAVLAVQNQLPGALEQYRAALAIDEAQLSHQPNNPQTLYNISFTFSDTGWILRRQGDLDAALAHYSKALEIRKALAGADPNDVRAKEGLSNTYSAVALIYFEKNDLAQAIRLGSESLAIRQALSQKDPANERIRVKVAEEQAYLGEFYAEKAAQQSKDQRAQVRLCREALDWMQKAYPVYKEREAQGKLVGSETIIPKILAQRIEQCTQTVARANGSSNSSSQ